MTDGSDRDTTEQLLGNQNYTLDKAYEEIGHGLTQRLMAYVNAIARTSGNFFTCSFAFLILE